MFICHVLVAWDVMLLGSAGFRTICIGSVCRSVGGSYDPLCYIFRSTVDGRAGGVGTFGLLWMAGKRTDFGVGQRLDYPIGGWPKQALLTCLTS